MKLQRDSIGIPFKTIGAMLLSVLVLILMGLGSIPAAEAQPFAYVANDISETVSVIDIATNTVAITIPVGDRPTKVAITPDGTHAYVPQYSSTGIVSVIDTSTNTVVATVAVGDHPSGVAITPDGSRAYVANTLADSISVIDTTTNTVVGSPVPVGDDGSRAYVANHNDYIVSVIDTAANTVVESIWIGWGPTGIAIMPDGSRAYVANVGPDTVSVIDTSTNTVVATVVVGDGPSSVAITPDGRYAYVPNYRGSVSVIDTATNTVTATVTVEGGGSLQGVAITPDGSYAYVSNWSDHNVSVIDTATNTVVTTVAVGVGPIGVAITPPVKLTCVGFEPPMDKTVSVKKKNRVLPLKMELLDKDGASITDLDINASPIVEVDYNGGVPATEPPETYLPAGQGDEGNQFVFTESYWQFNLQTKNFSGAGEYTIRAISGDPNVYTIIDPTCTATFMINE